MWQMLKCLEYGERGNLKPNTPVAISKDKDSSLCNGCNPTEAFSEESTSGQS